MWVNKPARLRFNIRGRPKETRGQGLPDLYLYYVVTHLGRSIDWCRNRSLKQWVGLEQETVGSTPEKLT